MVSNSVGSIGAVNKEVYCGVVAEDPDDEGAIPSISDIADEDFATRRFDAKNRAR